MKIRILFFNLLCFLLLTACSKQAGFPEGEWIDLTHEYSSDSVYWPTAEGFELKTVFKGMNDKGYFYSAYNYSADEHGGTHIDAPVHFYKEGKTIEQIPFERFIGAAIVIDVKAKAGADRDYQVGVADFTEWEKEHGKIPDDCIVLLNTGYAKYYPERIKYMGTDKRGEEALPELHFPGLDPKAALWLAENRKISIIGLDTPSIDYGQSTMFESHRNLFKNNILAIENVANVDKLPVTGATVLAFPMKIKGASGAPIRMAAFLPAVQ